MINKNGNGKKVVYAYVIQNPGDHRDEICFDAPFGAYSIPKTVPEDPKAEIASEARVISLAENIFSKFPSDKIDIQYRLPHDIGYQFSVFEADRMNCRELNREERGNLSLLIERARRTFPPKGGDQNDK